MVSAPVTDKVKLMKFNGIYGLLVYVLRKQTPDIWLVTLARIVFNLFIHSLLDLGIK